MVTFDDITAAHKRISNLVKETPILQSSLLDDWLGHQILFKAECLQTTGSFKVRGALNTLLKCRENNALPAHVVANSSGNHAQAVSYAARMLGMQATVFTIDAVSAVKAAATEFYGANLARYATRLQADAAVIQAAEEDDHIWLPPFNHPDVIAGQGTLTLHALEQTGDVNAIFAPCGGGGLLSGAVITARSLDPAIQVIGAEPLCANDAARSLRSGRIESLSAPPITLADGAATPAVGELNFNYLKQLDDFYEVDEPQIAYWTQWLQHLLKLHVEPTSAMSMAAVCQWLKKQRAPQKVLVMLTGGNIDSTKMQQIWQTDYLNTPPSLTSQI